jgi:hypothetical protein
MSKNNTVKSNSPSLRKEHRGKPITKGSRADIASRPGEVISQITLMMRPMDEVAAFNTLATCMELCVDEMSAKQREAVIERSAEVLNFIASGKSLARIRVSA